MEQENTNQENNLSKFGKSFQVKVIAALISDRAFLERIMDILSPDYFETDAHKFIIKLVMNYFPKYREIPTMEVMACEIQKVLAPDIQAAIKEQAILAYGQVSATDMVYVKEQFLEFCKTQKLKNAIFDSYKLLQSADYEGIWRIINDASKAGVERNLGHDYLTDVDNRLSDSAREIVKTNWELVDYHLDGGLGKGELGFVIAAPGSGKTWSLVHLGAEAMKQGKNVMHFSMELNEKYVGRRYDSYFSSISFQDVPKHKDQIKDSIKNIPGKLFIKYFPPKTVSATSLKMYVDRFTLITGIKIDFMIVDYADLLRPFVIEKNSNLYSEGGSIYVELRSVGGELQIPTWSASQCNRGSSEEDIIVGSGVADSFAKIMIGDFIMSTSRKTEDKISNTARVHIIKSRFGSDGAIYPCSFDASMGKIEIYDGKSVEGMEILSKAKTAEEGIKDILRKRWKETHGDKE